MYPTEESVIQYAVDKSSCETLSRGKSQDASKAVNKMLSQYLRSDKIYEMHDQDRNAIWSKRLTNYKIRTVTSYLLVIL